MKMNDCIEWTGSIEYRHGYGRLQVNGKSMKAHRHAWISQHGPIPNGLLVLHNCHNRKCVNVAHLRLGTHKDNMADRRALGRYNRDWNGRAKITEQQAEILVQVYKNFDCTQKALASIAGISHSAVSYLLRSRLK